MKLAGAFIAGVGVAFLTVAVWIYIASQTSHILAAALLGFIYLVAGGIVMMLGKPGHAPHHTDPAYAASAAVPPPQQPFAPGESVVPPLVSAFFFGLNAAQQSRNRGKKPF